MIERYRLRQAVRMYLHTKQKGNLARLVVWYGLFLKRLGVSETGLKFVMKGRRIANVEAANRELRCLAADVAVGRQTIVSMVHGKREQTIENLARRILFLKLPVIVDGELQEKGVLTIKFSETFGALYRLLDMQAVARYFRIVLEPSWVGYSLPEVLIWATLSPEKVVIMAPYEDDFRFIEELGVNLIPTTLGPADWVNPKKFHVIPGEEKRYDAIYVANFNSIKRVERYLRAIVRVSRSRPRFRAALVCAGHGGARQPVMATLSWAQQHADIEYFDAVDQETLNRLINLSRVNVLVSLREGANKCVAEGLFAGTPVLLIEECACGNHHHITGETGRVVPDTELEEALVWFSEERKEFDIRTWADENMSPCVSTDRLSRLLESLEYEEGRPWTRGLFAKVNQPELNYLDAENAGLLGMRKEFIEKFKNRESPDAHLEWIRELSTHKQGSKEFARVERWQ
ncbi:hypothetical protein QWY84_06150 [Aquisalimonas lutea]|uniref:glycosyltransferase n=1 Tax=Aquisalimonas lutea TaxID=1327750 RepID=UPI0025B491FF|nr:glycosyltransferase [Aquisalimonas lutea]MDN3517187.1 hypothetical protein [Aquisalimonas lutea]